MKTSELVSGDWLAPNNSEADIVKVLGGEKSGDMPWIGRFAMGFGAWIAGFFLMGFLVVLFDMDNKGPMIVVGLILVAGSVSLMRWTSVIFFDQLALAIGLAGHLFFFAGLYDWESPRLYHPLIGALVLCAPVYWFCRNSVQRFLSVFWIWVTGLIATAIEMTGSVLPLLVAVLVIVVLLLSGVGATVRSIWRPALWASIVGLLGILLYHVNSSNWEGDTHQIAKPFGVIAALAFSGLLWHLVRPEGNARIRFCILTLLLIGLGIVGAPGVVVSLALLAIAHSRANRGLEWLAIGAMGIFLMAFYYHLGIPLVHKAVILMTSGAVLLGLKFWLTGIDGGLKTHAKPGFQGLEKHWLKGAIVFANALLVLAVVNGVIALKQRTVETGRVAFLELAPVDPRSLMQGDYMSLAYALPREDEFKKAMTDAPSRGRVILTLDDKNLGVFSRLDDEKKPLGADEVRLKYRKWRRGWKFGIESFFFQEGLGDRYSEAKHAELRVSPKGDAVLVDLRSP